MSQFKKIIVATDFSEPSIEALREADLIAHRTGAELLVFHAVPNLLRNNPLFPQKNIEDAFQLQDTLDRVAGAVEELIDRHMHADCDRARVLVDSGWPDTSLMRNAEEIGADLIVVGSRGFTGLKHVLLGSVAQRVVRYAHCAVLVARASPHVGHVLATTDFSDPALPAIDAAVQIAKRRKAKLTLMHSLGVLPSSMAAASTPFGGGPIVPDKATLEEARRSAKDLLEDCLRRFDAEGETVVCDGAADDEIIGTASRLPADLIVMGSLGRTSIRRIALGSVAETVARTAACSVLIVRTASS